MKGVSTRVRLRVAPGAARAGVVGLIGVEPGQIERRLSSAAGKERRA